MSKLVPDSRARHALLALLDVKSQKDLATETNVPQPALSLIAGQKRRPGREITAKLAEIGIEYGWWGLPPTADDLAREAERKAAEAKSSPVATGEAKAAG